VSQLIEPRTLKGFRDYPPALMIPRERVLQTAREVYRSFGFSPIDTPAMEYAEILLGKGGGENDRIVYRFKDHGDRDVALRFDLTVPFARFSAQYVNQLGTPFKRYAMGPVWRGENTSAGRYREFWQCDFDTIGTTSNASDIEVALVINSLFERLGFTAFTIRVNNRLVLTGILEALKLLEKTVPVLRSVDKLAKIGRDKVVAEMEAEGIDRQSAESVR
jgi:histidyl-tRNA synthetase